MNGFALSDGSLLAQPSTDGLVPQFEKTYETRQKNVKSHDFLDFKKRKNVKGLKTTVTTLNQFC